MGEVLREIQDDWAEGVINSLESDRLPVNASPQGWNSMFYGVNPGRVTIRERYGCAIGNATAIAGTSAPVVLGQYAFKKVASGATTQQHLVISDAGRLDILSSGTMAAADTGTPSPFTAGTKYPCFATANNLCFMVNGTDAKKYDGTDVWNFGITRPTVGTMAGSAGAAGSPNGIYELRVSYYNSATGHESSASNTATATVTVTNQKIDVINVPNSADGQVTHKRIHIRNTATMTVFYWAGTIADNTTTTITLDFLDSALITQSPDTAENDPPPASIRYIAWYLSRMFAATDTMLYYSKDQFPEAFDPDNYVPINPNDGQRITGILPIFECLLVFKTRSIYALFGSPGSWDLRCVVPDIGCETFRTIATAEGAVYWLAAAGLMRMSTLGEVAALGQMYLSDTFNDSTLNISSYTGACAIADVVNNQILLALPEAGQTRNTRIIPFNYRVGRFDSDKWDPFDVASMGIIDDASTARPWVYFGGYSGQVFKWGIGQLDGIAAGCTTSGTVTSSASTATFSDSAAAFTTAGAGLTERMVIFVSPIGKTVRRRITSNTATQLTVSPVTADVVVGWTYTVGSPDFQWDTPWLLTNPRFFKKRMKHAYAMVEANSTVFIDILTDFAESVRSTLSFTASAGNNVWGSLIWGLGLWGLTHPHATARLRIGRTASAVKLRLRTRTPSQDVTLYALGVTGEVKSDRIR